MISLLLLIVELARADSAFSTVTLVDGQVLTGIATVLADGSVSVVVGGGTVVMLPAGAVRSVVPAGDADITRPAVITPAAPVPTPSAPAVTAPATAPAAPTAPSTPDEPLAVPMDAAAPVAPPDAGAPVAPPAASTEVPLPSMGEPTGGSPDGWPSDPNRVGYFYSPSAFMLGRGRGYVAQKELAVTAAAFGLTNFWDIQVGTVLPLLFTETPVGIAGTKLAFRVADGLRVGAGVQAFFVAGTAGLVPFVVATVGNEDRHLSVNAGMVALVNEGQVRGTVGLLTISGDLRLGAKTALLTENWVLIEPSFENGFFIVPTAGVRLFGPATAVDLGAGVFALNQTVIPLPWVGFTWNWGLPGAEIPAAR